MLATQTLAQPKPKSMRISYTGALGHGVTAKDLILGTIGQMGTTAPPATPSSTPARRSRPLDGAAHDGLQHVDRGRRPRGHDRARRHDVRVGRGPPGRAGGLRRGVARVAHAAHRRRRDASTARSRSTPRRSRRSSPGARTPAQVVARHRARCPSRARRPTSARWPTWGSRPARRSATSSSTACSSARARTPASATCAPPPRWSRAASVASHVGAMVVPGSQQVRAQAEREGLDEIFRAAGFDWRTAGCSMCLGMNPDILAARRALRVDLEPQLRGPPGPRRAHAPRVPADGGRGGDRGPLRRHPGVELDGPVKRHHRRRSRARRAPTSTPTRSSPSSTSSASSARASASSCSTTGRRRTGWSPAQEPDPRHRRRTSAAAPRREHAPWALQDYGFQAIVAPSFADIFFSNCIKIGLLPVVLPEEEVRALMEAGEAEVDLEALEVRFDGRAVPFELDAERRHRLLNGLDDIALTLQQATRSPPTSATRERTGPGHARALRDHAEHRSPARRRHRPRDRRRRRRGARRRRPTSTYEEHLFGGAAIDAHGTALTDETLAACQGGRRRPAGRGRRPEVGHQRARRRRAPSRACSACGQLGLFANLRPVRPLPALYDARPLKREPSRASTCSSCASSPAASTSASAAREDGRALRHDGLHRRGDRADRPRRLQGGAGARDERRQGQRARDLAGSGARSSRASTREEFPNIELEHLLVDNAAMQLVAAPRHFEVIVTENMFGDILSRRGGDAHRLARHAARAPRSAATARPVRARPRLGARHRGPGHRQPARR